MIAMMNFDVYRCEIRTTRPSRTRATAGKAPKQAPDLKPYTYHHFFVHGTDSRNTRILLCACACVFCLCTTHNIVWRLWYDVKGVRVWIGYRGIWRWILLRQGL